MTAIKATHRRKTILDFSKGKCSKNSIKQALRHCQLNSIELVKPNGNEYTVIINEVVVGMYTVQLHFPFDSSSKSKTLKNHGDFEMCIYHTIDDENPKSSPSIDLKRDYRFQDQYWVPFNFFGKLKIKHLVDIIYYCHRLDGLKAFL